MREDEHEDEVIVDEAKLRLMNSEGLSAWALASAMIAVGDREQGPQDAAGFLKHYDDVIKRGLAKFPEHYDVTYLNLGRQRMEAAIIDQVNWKRHMSGYKGALLN